MQYGLFSFKIIRHHELAICKRFFSSFFEIFKKNFIYFGHYGYTMENASRVFAWLLHRKMTIEQIC